MVPAISSYTKLRAELMMEDTGVCRGFHSIPLKVCSVPRDLFCVSLQIARRKTRVGKGVSVHMPAANGVWCLSLKYRYAHIYIP